MANTPFLDLVKPAGTDRALVSVINSNSDKIDTGVSTLSEQIANYIRDATYTYSSQTIEANSGKIATPDSSNKPTGYSTLAPLEVASGNVNVLIRGFNAVNGELYLVNNSNTSQTTTPTFKIAMYKG